ncbi:MAG TPA: haloacid dehalogenase type II [Thermoleophilaceae bacterium]
MARDFDWCTFDCYGTLIDWEGGAAGFLYEMALREGDNRARSGRELRDHWEAIQFELVTGPYKPYKQILAESLEEFAQAGGWYYDSGDGEALVTSMRSWQPFPDTTPALTRTREAGVKLAILSNTDRDIIEHSLKHLEVPFDEVVTAEDVGSYKPSDANFERVLDVVGAPAERVLHVAFGFKYDIGPAQRAGMKTAWVNRHVETAPGPERPDHEWRDLWGLAQLATGEAPPVPSA